MPRREGHTIDTYVAGRLRSHRKQLGISQSDIAKELGVTFQQIQKYEAGINRIGAGRLFQFALAYGVPLQDLFPKAIAPAQGAKHSEKIDAVSDFATTADGWRLCQAFMRITDPRQRKIIISLIEEMASG